MMRQSLHRLRVAALSLSLWTTLFAMQSGAQSSPALGIEALQAKIGTPFCFNPRSPWVDSGIDLKKGVSYKISAQTIKNNPYKDEIISCTPDGPRGLLGWLFDLAGRNPPKWSPLAKGDKHGSTKRLRVLRDRDGKRASFLTLIAAIGENDGQCNVIKVGKERVFESHADGRLYLFANDWPGGLGQLGTDRFYQTCDCCGHQFAPTYGNNKGHLLVTVTLVTQPR
jgi:hypothetical protein